MNILVLNAGSSSLKYQLLNMPSGEILCEGMVDRIGIEGGTFTHKINGKKLKIAFNVQNHKQALNEIINIMISGDEKVIEAVYEIDAIGHRVVHGGEKFSKSVLIDEKVLEAIEECEQLAPLHNPANKIGILSCKELMPDKPQVAVFDTAFHQSMKKENYLYPIPYEYYTKYGIRKYGFHGTSHKYVANRAAQILGKDIQELRIINCHVGNGASVVAVKNSQVVETSMGMTPLEGLMMGTRSGDIDPAIITFLMRKEGFSVDEIDNILNKKSGVFGVSGFSDMREIEDGFLAGDEISTLAMNMYINRIVKYIGSYTALMNGVDVITLTAGVFENSPVMRKLLADKLKWLGLVLDESANQCRGEEIIISKINSQVVLMVVPTKEEYMIARETYELVK